MPSRMVYGLFIGKNMTVKALWKDFQVFSLSYFFMNLFQPCPCQKALQAFQVKRICQRSSKYLHRRKQGTDKVCVQNCYGCSIDTSLFRNLLYIHLI